MKCGGLLKLIAVVALGIVSTEIGQGEERIALIIGNKEYRHIRPLDNPINDARAVAKLLKDDHYRVDLVEDGDVRDLLIALKRFAARGKSADVAVFYYAGHGFEVSGENYIAPVDVELSIDQSLSKPERQILLELALERETVPLSKILGEMHTKVGGLKVVMLDCCRDNPFATTRSWAKSRSGISGGLADVKESALPDGTLLVFSGPPGKKVPDLGGQGNSPFTQALIEQMEIDRGIGMMSVFTNVSRRVPKGQKPWIRFDGAGESLQAFQTQCLLNAVEGVVPPIPAGQVVNQALTATERRIALLEEENARLREQQAIAERDRLMAEIAQAEEVQREEEEIVLVDQSSADRDLGMQLSSKWDHNGSTMLLVQDGEEITITYDRPREGLRDRVGRGTVLFTGTIDGSTILGESRNFLPNYPPIEYHVTGTVKNEGSFFRLTGEGPKRNGSTGKLDRTVHDVLDFTRLR